MSLRHLTISRWLSQASGLEWHVLPSKFTSTNAHMFQPPASFSSFRRAFSLSADKNSFLSSRIRPRYGNMRSFSRTQQAPVFRRFLSSSRSKSASQSGQSSSLSQRLKALSREYGWSALGVYLLLSAMDFPFCFAAVRFLGAEKIGHYEHVVVEAFKGAVGTVLPSIQEEQFKEETNPRTDSSKGDVNGSTVEKKLDEGASLWTQVALAYAIHKSLIFIRVPLTAAITPKVVKVLRQWGWDIVKGKPKGM
ncbi:peptide alpha-N-acetyltransferase Nat2 [Aspergillus nomiae NRRL 13137]|uniref:Peptide alpha-N-acetyltransferase Nat2 n=1 Tax=Aspergillus nomiae NRRL (strain ATCC 15546 / NRRL 13137 / CBS 260.88 / M93) TaxID=1509407 RepID=A0A0L1ISJ4_ASPN3|nr:peptide alpha-N-acetyltransferase Nat2 [Aspergillus nomiae NRRL 13137]KNG82546.1 peptide alpha-N-acetyltransferase Nat2 [Aspergillus nomiae NRRL 13137]